MTKTEKELVLWYWKLTKAVGSKNKKIHNKVFDFLWYPGSDAVGAIYKKGVLYIVTAGSNDLRDWINNLMFWKKTREDVHAGFYYSARNIWEELHTFIKCLRLESSLTKVVFIGHSRGGGISIKLDSYCAKNFTEFLHEAVPFGAPRIGGKEHMSECTKLRQKVTRYEYDRDIVCSLPPGKFSKYGLVKKLPQPWYFKLPMFIFIHTHYGIGLKKLR